MLRAHTKHHSKIIHILENIFSKNICDSFKGSINPVNIDNVVVFPAPLCPKRANIYPLYIVKLAPLTAILFPKYFFKFFIERHSFFFSCLFKDSETGSKFLGFNVV